MSFEFDPLKSANNFEKHGIDFIKAQRLWDDPSRLVIPARTQGESRFLLIGKIDGKHWSAIFTMRGENTRIISVRCSRNEEVEIYEN
ncbi:MAG: BrnT family toxin [Lentisphaerae bacterium]|nr:BrnT family toxin [Lentisphaerota bacterium]